MSKNLISLVFVALLLCFVGSVFGGTRTWTNAGADQDWNNAANWAGAGALVTGDIALLGHWGAGAQGTNQPIVSSPALAVPAQLGIGWPSSGGPAEMTVVAGGSLTSDRVYLGWGSPGGVLHMEGGTLTANVNLIVGGNGNGSTGLIDMTGGVINAGTLFIDNGSLSAWGQVNLAGGTINADLLSVGANGQLDITGGTFVIGIDLPVNGMSSWNNWIYAYGGTGTLVATYDAGTNSTTITALKPPVALNPDPSDEQSDVPIDEDLTLGWDMASTAVSNDVYFGTVENEIFDANDTLPVGTSVFKAHNHDPNTYDISVNDLSLNTTYYWRIDEVEIDGTTHKGLVWEFTTLLEPEFLWTDEGSDHSWHTGENWNNHVSPLDGKTVAIIAPLAESPNGPVYQSGLSPQLLNLIVGQGSGGFPVMTMEGGILNSDRIMLGWYPPGFDPNAVNDGTLNMTGGTVNIGSGGYFGVGNFGGTGTLSMIGGEIFTTMLKVCADQPTENINSFAGNIFLDGGTIHVSGLASNGLMMGDGAAMDITEGVLILEGNQVSHVNSFIDPNVITASTHTYLITRYNPPAAPGKTMVLANDDGVDDPRFYPGNSVKATVPVPGNNSTDVDTDRILGWTDGITADSHDVYFGTDYDEIFDANDTLPVGSSVFKGNQDPNTYVIDIDDLSANTTYYWRIDEVEIDGITSHKGDVWVFTTRGKRNINWDDSGAGHFWDTPSNWDLGYVPDMLDRAFVLAPAAEGANGPVIDGIDAYAENLYVGIRNGGSPNMTVNSGSLTSQLIILGHTDTGGHGTLNMNGGTIDVPGVGFIVGNEATGTLNMTDGTINTTLLAVPNSATSIGQVNLDGGTINADVLAMPGVSGVIDIRGGTLVLDGNWESLKLGSGYISVGYIIGYGGQSKVDLLYDGGTNKTTLSARAPGSYPGDIYVDGSVNFDDLLIMIGQWPQTGWNLEADIYPWPDGDGTVDLLDVGLLGRDWQKN